MAGGAMPGVACCDTLRLRADFPTLPSESLFESRVRANRLFSAQNGDCDESYSGSYGLLRRRSHEAVGGRKSFYGLLF